MGTEQEAKLFRFHSHNIHYIVVLVKEAKHLASTQTMGNVEAKDFASIPTIYTIEYCCVDEQEAKHISLPMGNVEAKGLASIPTIYTIVVLTVKKAKHLASTQS